MKKTTIKKILIANRGEIACRIARTCKKLEITSVAVYSDADQNSKFVREASEAIALGGNSALESYLDAGKIIEAARKSGADAIHPGFGFLSENAAFAQAVENAGLIFIGPKSATIEKMGSKKHAKTLMSKSGVPVIPGYQGDKQSTDDLFAEALKVGFPCMIKASAGGGGKGLKLAHNKDELKATIESAKREAKSAFGDDTMLIEKFIQNPRHIEVQVFGDAHGHVVYLFERECTLQRRHQKVIEEAPSSAVNETLRKKLGAAAVLAAKSVDYLGAGTVEFVMAEDGTFYFLEMNTRLQVEHPVTEFITGLDLVEWQILVAQGEALPLTQKDLKIHGHAMEARVYAEDADNGFLPASGTIAHLALANIPNVRYDLGVDEGDEISVFYDPMIGKIIAHADTREACIHKLAKALDETTILGTTTNLWFLKKLILEPDHILGKMHTGFIADHLAELIKKSSEPVPLYFIAAAALSFFSQQKNSKLPLMQSLAGFRISSSQKIPAQLVCNGKTLDLSYRIQSLSQRELEISIEDNTYSVCVNATKDHLATLTINGHRHEIIYCSQKDVLCFKTDHGNLTITLQNDKAQHQNHASDATLTAPLPGKVLKIMTAAGKDVAIGEVLMIVEAMKMEHPIKASSAGLVKKIFFKENDAVKLGDVLIEMDEAS